MMHINDLPAEILAMIFETCQRTTDVSNVFEVCVHWRNILSRSCFWKTVQEVVPLDVLVALSRRRSLTSTEFVAISNGDLRSRNLELVLSSCPRLKRLRVAGPRPHRLLELLPGRCRIAHFTLVCPLQRLHPHAFYSFLYGGGIHLTHITIYCMKMTNAFVLLNQIADSCPTLRSIALQIATRDRFMVFPITRMQQKCPLLQAVQMHQFAFTVDERVATNGFPELQFFSCAHSLPLGGLPGISDSQLTAALKQSRRLRYLDLRGTHISVACLCELPINNTTVINLERALSPDEVAMMTERFGQLVHVG